MDWLDEVRTKLKRKNQVLFAKDAECLQDLAMLLKEQSHRTIVLWALDLAAESVAKLEEKHPDEPRPREALESAWAWAAGDIKMRLAQRKILDCHAFAKELGSKEDIALCHAVGQACAVVHTAGHAMGYPMYELSAIVYRLGIENCSEAVERRNNNDTEEILMDMEPMDLIRDKFSQECEIGTVRRLLMAHFDMTEEQAQAEIDEYFAIVDWMDKHRDTLEEDLGYVKK